VIEKIFSVPVMGRLLRKVAKEARGCERGAPEPPPAVVPSEDAALLLESPLFQSKWYHERYPEVAEKDALTHYLSVGWKEGRDPSEAFSTRHYLAAYPDVKAAEMNPLVHYLRHGREEKRRIRAASKVVQPVRKRPSGPVKRISCVVPNYNYERFLVERLESIKAQDYPIYELIVLDDNSTDGSDAVIRQWIRENRSCFHGRIQYVRNRENRGVFAQWKLGIEKAGGDCVWIAEADDTCKPGLVSELVPFFDDPQVNLAYVQSCLTDAEGKITLPAFTHDRRFVSASKWEEPYVYPLEQELNAGLAVCNTIPNVSAVIMRRTAALRVSDNPTRFTVAGDWLFYLEVLKGGRIAFSPAVLNNYRRHVESVYHRNKEQTVREIEIIHRRLLDDFRLSNDTIRRMQLNLLYSYDSAKAGFEPTLGYQPFLREERDDGAILVFIGRLTYGGGEIFPIRLANELAEQGHCVYLASFDEVPADPDIIGMISPRVQLVRRAELEDWGFENFLKEKNIRILSSHHYAAERFIATQLTDPDVFWSVTTHGMYELVSRHPEACPGFERMFPKIFSRCNRVIYIADKNLPPLESLPFDVRPKCIRINNGFTPKACAAFDRAALGIREEDVVLLLAARGVPEKGWEEVIAAIAALNVDSSEQGRQHHALLIGDSEYVEGLRLKHQHDRHLHFLGFQKNPAPYIWGCDIGVLPSGFVGESQPLCLIECMSCGKPVIASEIGEIPRMIRQGGRTAGVLLKLRDGKVSVPEFAEAVRTVTQEAAYREYAAGAREIAKTYDMSECARKYLSVFREFEDGRGAARGDGCAPPDAERPADRAEYKAWLKIMELEEAVAELRREERS